MTPASASFDMPVRGGSTMTTGVERIGAAGLRIHGIQELFDRLMHRRHSRSRRGVRHQIGGRYAIAFDRDHAHSPGLGRRDREQTAAGVEIDRMPPVAISLTTCPASCDSRNRLPWKNASTCRRSVHLRRVANFDRVDHMRIADGSAGRDNTGDALDRRDALEGVRRQSAPLSRSRALALRHRCFRQARFHGSLRDRAIESRPPTRSTTSQVAGSS